MIQALLTSLFATLDTVFQPILIQGPYISLAFFSIALAVIFTGIYWALIDKERIDKVKEKLQSQQEKMKEAQENEDSNASEHLQKTLELNQKFMMLNMKPMIGTMVFIAILFPWLSATYSPTLGLNPVDDNTYEGNMTYAQQNTPVQVIQDDNQTLIMLQDNEYHINDKFELHGITWKIHNFQQNPEGRFSTVSEPYTMKVAAEFVQLPFSLPIAGTAFNWLGFYILIVMPITIVLRKSLGLQ